MKIKNIDTREQIEKSGFKYWEIAEHLKITDGMFSKLLRKELSKEQKEDIKKIISELEKRKGE